MNPLARPATLVASEARAVVAPAGRPHVWLADVLTQVFREPPQLHVVRQWRVPRAPAWARLRDPALARLTAYCVGGRRVSWHLAFLSHRAPHATRRALERGAISLREVLRDSGITLEAGATGWIASPDLLPAPLADALATVAGAWPLVSRTYRAAAQGVPLVAVWEALPCGTWPPWAAQRLGEGS